MGPAGSAAGEAKRRAPVGGESGAPAWTLPRGARRPDDPLLDCLVVLAEMLERPQTPDALVAGLPLVEDRLTPELFVEAAERAGFSARILRIALRQVPPLALPAVLLLKDARACVLVARRDGRATIILPETGRGRLELDEDALAALYAGHAIFARPAHVPDAGAAMESAPARHWFWGTLAAFWRIYFQVALAALLVNVLALAVPIFAMHAFDWIVPGRREQILWMLAGGVGVVLVLEFALRTLRAYLVDTAARGAEVIIAGQVFRRVLGMQLGARPASTGALAQQLRELETLREFFASPALAAFVDLPFALLFIGVIGVIGGPLALVPLAFVPVLAAAGWIFQRRLARWAERAARDSAERHALVVEAVAGLETIKGIGAEGRMQRNWERMAEAAAESGRRARGLAQFGQHFAALASQLAVAGVMVVGVLHIFDGDLTVGAVVACALLAARAMAPFARLSALLLHLDRAKASLAALDAIMRAPLERPAGAAFAHRPALQGRIEFRDAVFRYPGQSVAALDGASFSIRPGERIALVGRVGAGKSTALRLLLGFYRAQSGTIRIDGLDIAQLDPADLRRAIGYVAQDALLFAGSVRDNIAAGMAQADESAILRAAEAAGVVEFTARSPQGLDLAVGERGEALSGGQRQAVAIARALVRDPPILVLDEPTSAMDRSAEDAFVAGLAGLAEGKTLLVATQRPPLLSVVERVIVLDAGKVVADGPRERVLDMLARGQIYGAG